MTKNLFSPFRNEAECLQINGLTIENRVDRVSIFGSIDITLDKEGLAKVKQLKSILDLTLAKLESTDLPDKVNLVPVETVGNPFK